MEMRILYGKGLEIYRKSPFWLQGILFLFTRPIPRSVMLGSGFHSFLQDLNETQWDKPDKLKKIEEKKLRALIQHAYDKVPYYHRMFKERHMVPEDVKTIEDLRKLPILTKEDVRNHFSELVAVNAKDYRYGIGSTSGSTGKPLKFYLDQQNREIQYASQWRQLNWAGIDFEDRIATFRGNFVYEFGKTKALWRFNALSKELDFNAFDIKESALRKCIRKLKIFSPDLIKGYPSVLQVMGKLMISDNMAIHPKGIQTSSESVSKTQREILEGAFNCEIYDWYGQSEYVVSAGQCPEGNYHVNVESGIMEFIKNGDSVVPGELGEIIGTGLCNYSMPFIRYRTEDVGRYAEERCVCGRGLPIILSLEGRMSDSIITPDGKLFSGAAWEHYWKHRISPHTPNVDYVHIIQKSKTRFLIEMFKKEQYSDEETQAILRELKLLLGSEIEIRFKDLDSIPIGRKQRFTESELDVSF